MKKQLSFFLVFSCAVLTVSAQQRIGDASTGSKLPNKDAILELESKNKALLVSRIALSSTTVATPLSVHTAGMIAYNTATINDVVPGIYYNDGTKWLLVGKGETTNIKYDPVTNIISYIDGSGNAVTIDIAGIVRGSQTVTKVVAEVLDGKNTGKYTYYNEKDIDKDGNITGPGTVINVVGDVQNNFQEIVNNTAVKQIFETIVKNTGGNVSYNATTNSFTYVDGTGTTQTINITDMVKNNETLTTLAYDNATKVLTYKDEAGTTNTINIGSLVKNNETLTTLAYDNATKVLTYKDEKGLNTSIDISTLVSGNETLTVLSYDNATNTLTYKDEAGTTNTINIGQLVKNNETLTTLAYDNATKILTYKDEKGLNTSINISTLVTGNETLTVLSYDNATNTLTYKDEAGTTNTINLTNLVQNNQKNTSVSSGTYTTVAATTPTTNNTDYKVDVNPSTLAGPGLKVNAGKLEVDIATIPNASDKTATVANGTNTTVTTDATNPNNPIYKVNVATASGTTLGVVKEAATTPTVNIASDGTLSVNTTQLQANQKTSSVVSGTTTTVSSATTGNNTAYTVEINPSLVQNSQKLTTLSNGNITTVAATTSGNTTDYKVNVPTASTTLGVVKQATTAPTVDIASDGTLSVNTTQLQANQKTSSVTGTGLANVTSSTTGNNTNYTVDVTATAVQGSQKTSSVVGTTTASVSSAVSGNNTAYTVSVPTASTTLGVVKEATTTPTVNIASDGTLSVNTTQLQANQKTSSVVSGTTTTVSSATTGNNTAYTVEINPSSVQNSQKLTTLSNGNNTTVASTTSGNTTDYKVNVNNATAAATGAVKPGSGLTVAADGTLSVNTTASGLGKNLTPADGSIFIGTGTGATLVDANVSVATGGITDTKIAADAVTTTKIANSAVTAAKLSAGAGAAGRVGITDASGAITYGTLPAGSVTGNNFTSTDLTITNGTGATLTAVSAVIAPNAVTTAKIANGTILDADIAAAAAIAVTKLANGADGQVLTTNGSVPTWTNPSALAVNNLYTSNGSLTANRTVDLNAKTLTFKDNIAANAGASTELSYASGNASMLHSAAATKRSEIILTTNGSQLNVFQDPGAPSQIITSGTSTSLNIGTGTSNPMTLATNSAPRMIVAANGNIGMGTGTALTTPSNVLHVNATNPLRLEGLQGQAAVASNQLIVADNTGVLKTIAAAGNNQMLTTNGSGVPTWTNQSTIASSLEPWRVQGTTNGATSNADNIYQTGNVAIGATTAPAGADASAKLYVNGTITTANSLYADYVFEDYFEGASRLNNDYTFKSLKEIEEFIYKNKHLPGVTGIKGLAKNDKGEYVFNISKLSVQLLEKVEELYLHTIEQQKKLDIKDKEIQDLKAQQQKTEERLKRLEEAVLGKANK